MKKKILVIALVIYALLVLVSTKALLDRNDYGVFETKSNNYYVGEVEGYSSSSLLKFAKNVDYEKLVDKDVYYFERDKIIRNSKLTKYDSETETFTINGDNYKVNNFLGEVDKEYKTLGSILNVITSKGFYFIFIIIPIVVLFMFEIYLLVKYVDYNKNRKDNNNEKKQNKKAA